MSNWLKKKSRIKTTEFEIENFKSKNDLEEVDDKNGSDEELEQILQVSTHVSNDVTTDQNPRDKLTLTSSSSRTSPTEFPRAVRKDGSFNWSAKTVGRHRFLLEDIFTTLVDLQWRLLLFVFCLVYFGSWLAFSVIWYGLLYFHGDFEDVNYGNSTWRPCITEFKDFTAAFLFSVETQHTTGYGYYHLTEECASTIITFCLQSIVGCILEGVMVGILFVKIARGKKRTATLLFSKTAVVLQHKNRRLNFMFRVADLRNKSNLLEARIRAQLITRQKVGQSDDSICDLRIGEFFLQKEELKVFANGEQGTDFFLFWPTTIIHEITTSSPLYRFLKQIQGKHNGDDCHFEIIVVLEGIVEATGQMTQARSSYIPSEVIWGHSFTPMTMTPKKKFTPSEFEIDYSNFHETFPVTVTRDVNVNGDTDNSHS